MKIKQIIILFIIIFPQAFLANKYLLSGSAKESIEGLIIDSLVLTLFPLIGLHVFNKKYKKVPTPKDKE